MTQTFDIRFARSAGLSGLFERPANEFRWKGDGRLSIDASGISIAAKRGLLTLFARAQSRRFARSSLVEVYREGNALRLAFSTHESPRTVLPVWVSDRDAAAQIVTLLPTQRSVELEEVGHGKADRYRIDRRMVAVLVIVVMMIGMGALVLQRYFVEDLAAPLVEAAPLTAQPVEDSTIPPALTTLTEVGPPTPAYRTPAPRVVVIEERGGRSVNPAPHSVRLTDSSTGSEAAAADGYASAAENSSARAGDVVATGAVAPTPEKSPDLIALEQFALFRAESTALHSDYLYARDSLAFESLEAIEARWLSVTSRIVNTEEFSGIEFYALRELELAISRNWRDHVSILAAALRAGGDRRLMELADAHLAFAEAVEAQLPLLAP